jgi:autotransporter-associated beta strand protein
MARPSVPAAPSPSKPGAAHADGRRRHEHDVRGTISGTGGLSKNGSGTLVPSGTNTHSGDTSLQCRHAELAKTSSRDRRADPTGSLVDYANCTLSAGDHGIVTQAGGAQRPAAEKIGGDTHPCSSATTARAGPSRLTWSTTRSPSTRPDNLELRPRWPRPRSTPAHFPPLTVVVPGADLHERAGAGNHAGR